MFEKWVKTGNTIRLNWAKYDAVHIAVTPRDGLRTLYHVFGWSARGWLDLGVFTNLRKAKRAGWKWADSDYRFGPVASTREVRLACSNALTDE